MRILAAIHPTETTRAILGCLELPSRAPPTLRPRVGATRLNAPPTGASPRGVDRSHLSGPTNGRMKGLSARGKEILFRKSGMTFISPFS
jgi:hypothetical protein